MKRMLFNATHSEELRIAVVDGQTLVDLDIDFIHNDSKRGNIYKGVISKIEPSLEAAFVDYGTGKHGFLSLKDISRKYFSPEAASTPLSQVRIQDVVKVDDSLTVQVEKEERGNKGAVLTTFISLAGRYLVLLPDNPKGGGISRQIEGAERNELRKIMKQLEIPDEHSVIARTAGFGQSSTNFQIDLSYLTSLWKAIQNASESHDKPFLIYKESSIIVRALRDYLRDDIRQILIDNEEIYKETKQFIDDVMPNSNVAVRHYTDTIPLFSRFQIEHQIEGAFERTVTLPNGGAIVIDQTEALVTIDVNSARATKGVDIEDTAFQTNMEAVEQIAKQLRVRDIGGLIVIDLIDMNTFRNKKNVEARFNDALRSDRARVQVGKISRFGLLEMSRQRLRSSIEESSHDICPRCHGRGFIRNIMSSSLSILRIIQEDALKENTELIHAHLPVEIATFLLNEKRSELNRIEQSLGTTIVVIPTPSLQTPNSYIKRFRPDEIDVDNSVISYDLDLPDDIKETYTFVGTRTSTDSKPAIKQHDIQSSNDSYLMKESKVKKFLQTMFGGTEPPNIVEEEKKKPTKSTKSRSSKHQGRPRKKTPSTARRSGGRPRRGGGDSRGSSQRKPHARKSHKRGGATRRATGNAREEPKGEDSRPKPRRRPKKSGSGHKDAKRPAKGKTPRGRRSKPSAEVRAD